MTARLRATRSTSPRWVALALALLFGARPAHAVSSQLQLGANFRF